MREAIQPCVDIRVVQVKMKLRRRFGKAGSVKIVIANVLVSGRLYRLLG